MTDNMFDTPAICELCHADFMSDGYQWICDNCKHPAKDCECGSDDITLDWHIVNDQNGELCWEPMWCVDCASCERTTAYFKTAQEAHAAWMNGYAERVLE